MVTILLVIVVALLAALAGYAAGRRAPREPIVPTRVVEGPHVDPEQVPRATERIEDAAGAEKSRLVRRYAAWAFEADAAANAAVERLEHERALAAERGALFRMLADATAETARYRQIVLDIEHHAPPPILSGAAEPDDLKLIVGVGPSIERMLHALGVTTFRQIACWTPRDAAAYDAKLTDFPGRIERDQWITQARSLHEAKYGTPAARRERT